METIGHSFKETINRNFKFTDIERNAEGIYNTFNNPIKGSNNMVMLPKVEKVDLEAIDDLHDKLSLSWSDYKVEGVVTWKPSINKISKKMVFCGIE